MEKKCLCNTSQAGPVGNISFKVESFNFNAFKRGGQCAACLQKYFAWLLEKHAKKLFKDAIHCSEIINWKYFVQCENNHDEWNNAHPETVELLSGLGFLSAKPKGNWEITDGAISLNPMLWANTHYFTRKPDVLAYAKAKFANTEYAWFIRNIGEVISKEEVLAIA